MDNPGIAMDGINCLVLASGSPRRRELLGNLGIDIRIARTKDVDESFPPELKPEEVAPYISQKKSAAYLADIEAGEILVTADTVVINNGKAIGKPADKAEAAEMIASLSGHTHKVVTGVTLARKDGGSITFAEETDVEFSELTPEEIGYYVERFMPLDKAGAYGIQEWIGYIGIKGIRGDYYNVMGLPMHALYQALKRL